MEATHSHQSFLSSSFSHGNEEAVQFQGACREFEKHVEGLRPTDAVVLEASRGSFWWADQIEAKGAKCFVNECHGVPCVGY